MICPRCGSKGRVTRKYRIEVYCKCPNCGFEWVEYELRYKPKRNKAKRVLIKLFGDETCPCSKYEKQQIFIVP